MLVRALTFRKNFAHNKHEDNWWTLVGHSDELTCSEMASVTLADLKDFNDSLYKKDSKDAYHHVVFLIDSEDQGEHQEDDKLLWETDNNFVSITRIHFPDTVGLSDQFDKLKQFFANLSSQPEYEDIYWRVYYTMELSDMVLVSKSYSLQLLSRWSLLATKTKLVGSAYTYFCIPGSLIDMDSSQWPENLNTDFIDFMSIRFSIQNGNVNEALQHTRECLGKDCTTPVFRVAGNEDALICGQNVPVKNLIKLYQGWYQDGSNILCVFRDIITRLGTMWDIIPPPLEVSCFDRDETRLAQCCKALQQKVKDKALFNKSIKGKEWLRPLVSLTNALVHMSHSTTLDAPVSLVLPALDAFWDNMLSAPENSTDETMYLRFSELCIHTIEHLMREEGQLSHRPEMRPLTYDMPVFVLEYATTFLLILREKLTVADGKTAERIRFLLVPSADTDVSTEEPFEAKGSIPGLLQTTVPFSLLYKPKYLLPALCHEMAHYVGETVRNRDKRYGYFLNSAATELIKYFFDKVDDKSNKLMRFLSHDLDKSIRAWIKDNIPDDRIDVIKLPLLDIVSLIKITAEDLVDEEKPDAYANLVRRYVLSEYRGAQLYSIPQDTIRDRLPFFVERLGDLLVSYREAYADICMLYLLEIDPLDYLEVAVHRWEVINTGMLLRAYASLKVSGHSHAQIINAFEIWGEEKAVDGKKRDHVRIELNSIGDLLQGKDICAEHYLIKYLEDCWMGFQDAKLGIAIDENDYTVKEIYDKMMGINNGVKYKEIVDIIDRGRKAALDQLTSS